VHQTELAHYSTQSITTTGDSRLVLTNTDNPPYWYLGYRSWNVGGQWSSDGALLRCLR
jgi:hypothetical protein